jgi:hypothetical protein
MAVGAAPAAFGATQTGWGTVSTPSSTPPASCADVNSPYDYTQQAASKCFATDPLVSVSSFADGGTEYAYRQASGALAYITVPPAGFDPINATAGELMQYGLPARPTDPLALLEWQSEMSKAWWATPPNFLAQLPGSEPPAGSIPNLGSNALAAPALESPNATSPYAALSYSTYAGWGTGIPGQAGTSADSTFLDPSYSQTCSPNGYSVWSGLQDGYGDFGQDGVLTQNGTPPYTASNEAFWEFWVLGTEQQYGLLQKIPAGDWARANDNYTGSAFTGTVTNVTTGQVTGWSAPYSGRAPTQAEVFVEHPAGYNLSDFGAITVRAASADGTELSWNPFIETASDGSMTTNAIGNGGAFSVSWNHC